MSCYSSFWGRSWMESAGLCEHRLVLLQACQVYTCRVQCDLGYGYGKSHSIDIKNTPAILTRIKTVAKFKC